MTKTIELQNGEVLILDQTRLPLETVVLRCHRYGEVAEAIRSLRVRGAPAIGLAAACAAVLAAQEFAADPDTFAGRMEEALQELAATRPTAVNLFWALDRVRRTVAQHAGAASPVVVDALRAEADRMLQEDEAINRAMGAHGAAVIPDGAQVLTHCNAGALATGAYGTALGVIRAAHEQGKRVHVWVDETRPLLQGARLTTWELRDLGIPHTLITDNMAAQVMAEGRIDLVIVGADRIAANGDVANKIGTYGVAVLAQYHHIPVYVAAPLSTVDLTIPTGASIPIEQRRPEEVTHPRGVQIAPDGTLVYNPAFDVTPHHLIAGIVTEHGIVRAPFAQGLQVA